MQREIANIPVQTHILLHSCCAPCTTAVLEALAPHFAVTLFYYNPNIMPNEEYARRLAALESLTEKAPAAGTPVTLLQGEYNTDEFLAAAKGLEAEPEGGARCAECFRLRLYETARTAKEKGIPWISTTLTVSPHKNAAVINQIGMQAAENHGVSWLPADFKKKEGYKRSIKLSEEYGLYRQSYCGCLFAK